MMATQKFFEYGLGGDKFKLELTEEGGVILVHEIGKGEPARIDKIEGRNDEEIIRKGLETIGDLAGGVLSLDDAMRVATEGLEKARDDKTK